MSSDDSPEYGYDPDVRRDADPHAVGADVPEQSYRQLARELTSAGSVRDLTDTIKRYGWLPPFLGLLLHGVARGAFEFLSEPFAMSEGYVFTGWQLALLINVVYGAFLVGFSWFMYFGVIGAIAGFFSDETSMETDVLKVGGYLTVLFVPLMAIASLLALSTPAPETVVAGAESTARVAETHRAVDNSLQMRIVDVILAGGWIVVGFLMLPVVGDLYDVDRKESVLSVLPVTLVAVVATQLI